MLRDWWEAVIVGDLVELGPFGGAAQIVDAVMAVSILREFRAG